MTSSRPRGNEQAPNPDCAICFGAGFVKKLLPLGGSELLPCHCTQDRQRDRAYQQAFTASNLGPARRRETFEAFDPLWQPLGYRAARAFAADPQRWLVLLGATGAGKTHLLSACANALLAAGRQPLYWCCPDLWQHFQQGYRDGDFPARLEAVRGADILLLDDFGADSDTDDRAEKLFMVMNHRIAFDLPLALSTNLAPAALPPRLKSRLLDRTRVMAVNLEPRDYRTGEGQP